MTPGPSGATYRHVRLLAGAPWIGRWIPARLLVLPLLLNFVRFQGFDVLHLHGDDWFYLRRKLPTVRTLHGSALYEARYATSVKRKLVQYLVYPLEHLSASLATVAAAVGRQTGRVYGIEQLVDNGVDPDVFHPGPKDAIPRLLYVGTWEGRKRGRWLHRLFANRIVREVPGVRLDFVSDICNPHPSVNPIRFPDDRRLAELYRNAWVFAYPSVYEGFGIAYLEALASGTAVLSSPNGGAAQVLEDGKYGVIASDESFGDELVDLLRNKERRRSFEERGLERARSLSWEAVAARHREIYQKAIARWRSGKRR